MVKRGIFLFLFLILCSTQAFAANIYGFRKYNWGDPPSVLGDSKLVTDNLGVKRYVKNDENMRIGPNIADSIIYMFYQEKLAAVIIRYSNISYFQNFTDMLEYKYSGGRRINDYEYQWDKDDGTVWLTFNQYSSEGKLVLSSRKYVEQYTIDQRKNSEAGIDDF